MATVDSVGTVRPDIWCVIRAHHIQTGHVQVLVTRVWQGVILYPRVFFTNISDGCIELYIPVVLFLKCEGILRWWWQVRPGIIVRMAAPEMQING